MPNTETGTDAAVRGQLQQRLEAGQFVVTAEIVPPVSCDRRDLLAKVQQLKGAADAVNVTDGAGARSHMGSLAAATLLLQAGIEPILQLTCRDRNRIALQNDLLAAAALGVRNLLLLRGDDPRAGDQPEAKPVFDLDSSQLSRVAAQIRDERTLMSGQRVEGTPDFFIGAADAPIDPPPGWTPKRLKEKIVAGAQFAQTQFCMDANVAKRYAQCLADNGVRDFHLLIGVVPLRSARSARWIREKLIGSVIPDQVLVRLERAKDQTQEGRRICMELVEELSALPPPIAGVHVMAPGNDAGMAEVVAEAARVSQQRGQRPAGSPRADEGSEAWLLHLQ
jgi:methylenetetrahydrofolate reductase (NADPH)